MAGLDELLGQILGGSDKAGGGGFDIAKLQALLAPLMGMLQQQGGIGELLKKLQQNGLPVNSWLSPGANEAVAPDALGEALGSDTVEELATESQMTPEEVKGGLSELLPGLVDKLSPNGQLPASADQLGSILSQLPGGDQLAGMLGGLLGGNK